VTHNDKQFRHILINAGTLVIKHLTCLKRHPFACGFKLICMTVHIETHSIIHNAADQPHICYLYNVFNKDKYWYFICWCDITDKHTANFVLLAIYCDRLY